MMNDQACSVYLGRDLMAKLDAHIADLIEAGKPLVKRSDFPSRSQIIQRALTEYFDREAPKPKSTWPEDCPTCHAPWRTRTKTMGAAMGQPHRGVCENGHRWYEPAAVSGHR